MSEGTNITIEICDGVVTVNGVDMVEKRDFDYTYSLYLRFKEDCAKLRLNNEKVAKELARVVAENERMREALREIVRVTGGDADQMVTTPEPKIGSNPRARDLSDWLDKLLIWAVQQIGRKGLGLPHTDPNCPPVKTHL